MQQDEDIRIIDLPEVDSLSPGMMVAVDSEAAGSKSFDLGTLSQNIDTIEGQVAAIRQVPESSSGNEGQVLTVDSEGTPGWADVPKELPATLGTVGQVLTVDQNGPAWNDIPSELPSTMGTSGQVLTFDGTDIVWANPPEGVYVLNYTEIGSFTDIDVDRMKTQPTFVRIDAAQSITIKTSLTNTITIPLEIGTMMRLVEQDTAWAVFVAEKVQYYPTGTGNAAFGASACHVNVLLRICKSDVSSTTKIFSCYGDIEDTSALFNGEYNPMPCTVYYQNGRGAYLDTGNVSTQYTGRATAVQFNSASGKYRRNLLMPEEIQSHDFANDSTPEQIQFMGWGATSNRAGYRTINEVPASTSIDAGKVLAVASNGTAGWGNAVGFVKNVGALTDAATITASNLNNGFATLSTSQSTLTIIDVVGTDEIVNFAVEITPSVNCTLTIKKKAGSSEAVTLKHSVAAGNTLEANKTYQVTAVGNCWTLAEFEA